MYLALDGELLPHLQELHQFRFCKPWLPTDGVIVGHNQPLFGLASRSDWNVTIPRMCDSLSAFYTLLNLFSTRDSFLELSAAGRTALLATYFMGFMKISATTEIVSVMRAGM